MGFERYSLQPALMHFSRSPAIACAVSAMIYHAYRKSGAMARLFGEEGTSVVTRLSAFLLLCIGVQIMITGAVEIGQSVHGGASRP